MRILFSPCEIGQTTVYTNIKGVSPPPLFFKGGKGNVSKTDLVGGSKNVGNIIHNESLSCILDFDVNHSSFVSLGHLIQRYDSIDELADLICNNFDYLVIHEANLIRYFGANKEESESSTVLYKKMADLLLMLKIPFAVFGVGLQNYSELPTSKADFDQNILSYLQVCEQKANAICVRGELTKKYLNGVLGLDRNIFVTGCPSMFVYPQNLLGIEYLGLDKVKRVASAGYLSPYFVYWQKYRIDVLKEITQRFYSDYFFQEDIYQLFGQEDFLYNYATGELGKQEVYGKLSECWINEHGDKFNISDLLFNHFYFYNNSVAWRTRLSGYDLYIGDRLHGGIAALQCGIPAIFLYDDDRLGEMKEFFLLPSVSLSECKENSLWDKINDVYSNQSVIDFQENYREKYQFFNDLLVNIGLKC